MLPICLFGLPADYPGACRESGDVALLWLQKRIPLTVLPCNPIKTDNPWLRRLTEAGAVVAPPSLCGKPPDWLKDCIVVDFQAARAVQCWPELHARGCRLAHCPTHCAILPHEEAAFKIVPPSAIVCESEFQRSAIAEKCNSLNVPQVVRIPAAFDASLFPYQPCPRRNHVFTVGAIGREDPAKWPRRILKVLKEVKSRGVKVRGRFLGWTPAMEKASGKLPPWVQHIPPGGMKAADFLKDCHAILCFSDYLENWPRVVLEAMATGVLVVADARGGYMEQISNAETGILAPHEGAAALCLSALASENTMFKVDPRLRIVEAARDSLSRLACPEAITDAWRRLFASLSE